MSYKRTLRGVDYLIDNELDMAREENGEVFSSLHEGAAVLHEEVDEALDEIETVKQRYAMLWLNVKQDDPRAASCYAEDIASHAERLACEAIQVAAMALKFIDTVEEAKNGEDH